MATQGAWWAGGELLAVAHVLAAGPETGPSLFTLTRLGRPTLPLGDALRWAGLLLLSCASCAILSLSEAFRIHLGGG